MKFFGEMLTKDGLKPDQEKVAAVEKMSSPKSKKELVSAGYVYVSVTVFTSTFPEDC